MHINSYGLFVESVKNLESGLDEIVITDLWNIGMPLIRYSIGDIGNINKNKCKCGKNLYRINNVDGRTVDIFENLKGQKIPGVAFTNRIIQGDKEIKECQIVQKSRSDFDVYLVPGENLLAKPL